MSQLLTELLGVRTGLRKTGAGAPVQNATQGPSQAAARAPEGPAQTGLTAGAAQQRSACAAELSRAKKRKSVRFNIPPEGARPGP